MEEFKKDSFRSSPMVNITNDAEEFGLPTAKFIDKPYCYKKIDI